MIENSQQRFISEIALQQFQHALNRSIDMYNEAVNPRLFIAMLQGMRSQIIEIEENLAEYNQKRLVNFGVSYDE